MGEEKAKEDEAFRTELKRLVAKANDMYQKHAYKNPDYGELCIAAVRLVEGSDFGRRAAESELVLAVERDYIAEIMESDFDGTAVQLLGIARDLIGRFGKVSVEPYHRGLGTKSAKLRFVPAQI